MGKNYNICGNLYNFFPATNRNSPFEPQNKNIRKAFCFIMNNNWKAELQWNKRQETLLMPSIWPIWFVFILWRCPNIHVHGALIYFTLIFLKKVVSYLWRIWIRRKVYEFVKLREKPTKRCWVCVSCAIHATVGMECGEKWRSIQRVLCESTCTDMHRHRLRAFFVDTHQLIYAFSCRIDSANLSK